jgi:uncharacterized membrane protein YoaK (UPF0700 family)
MAEDIVNRDFYHFTNRNAGRLLCVCGGFIDATGYVLVKGIFPASVTGNIVKLVYFLTKGRIPLVFILTTLAYGLGTGIVTAVFFLLRTRERYSRTFSAMMLLNVELLLLILSMIVGITINDFILISDPSSEEKGELWPLLVQGVLLGLSMGSQVGTTTCAFKKMPNSTGMTRSLSDSFNASTRLFLILLHQSSFFNAVGMSIEDQNRSIENNLEYHSMETCVLERRGSIDESTRKNVLEKKWVKAKDDWIRSNMPLLSFTAGAFIGIKASETFGFYGLIIPQLIIVLLIAELAAQNIGNEYVPIDELMDTHDPGIEPGIAMGNGSNMPTSEYQNGFEEKYTEQLNDAQVLKK